jgi:hypothetical protein
MLTLLNNANPAPIGQTNLQKKRGTKIETTIKTLRMMIFSEKKNPIIALISG